MENHNKHKDIDESLKTYFNKLENQELTEDENIKLINFLTEKNNALSEKRKILNFEGLKVFKERLRFPMNWNKGFLRPAISVAALIIIIVGIYFFLPNKSTKPKNNTNISQNIKTEESKIIKTEKKVISDNQTKSTIIYELEFIPLKFDSRSFINDDVQKVIPDSLLFKKVMDILITNLKLNKIKIKEIKRDKISTQWYYYKEDNIFIQSRLLIEQINNDKSGLIFREESKVISEDNTIQIQSIKQNKYKKLIRDVKTDYFNYVKSLRM